MEYVETNTVGIEINTIGIESELKKSAGLR
jgi:hypothetical protein